MLNLFVGLILVTNLYLLTGITHIPHLMVIGFSMAISFLFLLRRFNWNTLLQLLNNWLVVYVFVVSVFLFVLDFFIHESATEPNDMVRVAWYALYFSWTSLLLKNTADLKKWIGWLSFLIVLVLIIEGISEYNQPILWSMLFPEGVGKRNMGRIGGSLVDANSFACTLILVSLIWVTERFNLKKKLHWVMYAVVWGMVLFLTDISGSRQGALILLMIAGYLLFRRVSLQRIKWMFAVVAAIALLLVVFQKPLAEYAEANRFSSVARLFGNSTNQLSAQSNQDREVSIVKGLEILQSNYFVYGPGIFNFYGRWTTATDAFVPHNGFLFLLVQYGLFSIPVFYLYYLSFLRSRQTGIWLVFLGIFVHLFFQPNSMYYGITFLVMFYIDVKYRFREVNLSPDRSDATSNFTDGQ